MQGTVAVFVGFTFTSRSLHVHFTSLLESPKDRATDTSGALGQLCPWGPRSQPRRGPSRVRVRRPPTCPARLRCASTYPHSHRGPSPAAHSWTPPLSSSPLWAAPARAARSAPRGGYARQPDDKSAWTLRQLEGPGGHGPAAPQRLSLHSRGARARGSAPRHRVPPADCLVGRRKLHSQPRYELHLRRWWGGNRGVRRVRGRSLGEMARARRGMHHRCRAGPRSRGVGAWR